MTKQGFQVFDTDSHVIEPSEVLDNYIDKEFLHSIRALSIPGQSTYAPNDFSFPRRMGSQTAEGTRREGIPRFKGTSPRENCNVDPAERLADMDLEGIDIGMIVPTTVSGFSSVEVPLELAVYRAYHRFLTDYCGGGHGRITGSVVASGRAVQESVEEIKRAGQEPWAVGILPVIPAAMPFDDPSLDSIWQVAQDLDLTVVLHTFTSRPPYGPGILDGSFFGNRWLARSAGHPWCGMRNMAALIGGLVLDTYPRLRIALLEAGHGWLPYWVSRLDEQADYYPDALPSEIGRFSDYARSGRYFQSIQIHEGEDATEYVIDSLGSGILMFSTDYPHGESWFPKTVDTFLGWNKLSDEVKRQLLWGNPVQCFPRSQD
jgi:predicted TIM-barrel fold metal-dependent hydrolase